MALLDAVISKFPGIEEPKTHLNFKSRLMWTGIILLLFLILGQITIYGVSEVTKERFQFLEIVLGASFGTLMTLGIGPIVTASIILQLLVGSQIINWDLKTTEGKKKFQGTQKLLTVFFAFFEAFAYVKFGAVQAADPSLGTFIIVVLQLAFGGLLVLLMDEVVSKWGIGSGVSLFIAAGVSKGIMIRAFNPLTPTGSTTPAGLIPLAVTMLARGDMYQVALSLLPIIATIIVFVIVVYAQSLKVEIPLAFGSIRGFGRRWPLNLIYTSNIPVILVSALLANFVLVGNLIASGASKCGLLGCFDANGNPISGIMYFLQPSREISVQIFFIIFLGLIFVVALLSFFLKFKDANKILGLSTITSFIISIIVTGAVSGLPTPIEIARIIVYMLFMIVGSVVFSIFWVMTAGMDARAVAGQIEGVGMQVPGFRRDPRIIEQVLNRYIPALSIISGIFLGILASFADFTGALGTGTGILLTVMIVYQLYEQISMRYVEDMNPAFRKFFGGN